MDTLRIVVIGIVAVAVLVALAIAVYEFRQAGNSLGNFGNRILDIFGPATVVTPPNVQKFLDEPSNNGYVPWSPEIEDESFPPAWLVKGAKK